MSSTLIHSSTDVQAGYSPNRLCFKNPRGNGNYYAFFLQNTDLKYCWSSTGYDGWSSAIKVADVVADTISVIMTWIEDGSNSQTLVYFLWNDGTDIDALRATIADSGDTLSAGSVHTILTSSSVTDAKVLSAAPTGNGRPVGLYVYDSTYRLAWNKNVRPIESEMSASNWNDLGLTDESESFDTTTGCLVPYTNDDVLGCFYTVVSSTLTVEAGRATLPATLGGASINDVALKTVSNGIEPSICMCDTQNTRGEAYVVYIEETTNSPIKLEEYNVAGASLTTRDPSIDTDWSTGTVLNSKTAIAIDPNDDDIVFFYYLKSGEQNIFYTEFTPSTNAFGTEQEIVTGDTAINRLGSASVLISFNGENTPFLVWEDIVSAGVTEELETNLALPALYSSQPFWF